MRLAVIAGGDPLDVRTWSGTPYFMTQALQERFPDLLAVRSPRPRWLQWMRRAVRRASGGRIDLFWSRLLARWNAGRLARQLRAERIDVAFCVGNAPLSAFLAERMPVVHVSDATVPLMRDYYREFSMLPKALARAAFDLDRASVLSSSVSLFSTEWAARSAVQHYGADPSRVHAIPWGANVARHDAPVRIETFESETCRLVFIGVDWERKGGDIAVAAARRLARQDRPVTLQILGAKPPLMPDEGAVSVCGFIAKSTDEGRKAFDEIMRNAAFLFVPTRQDCSPMVFAEANSYGVPVITTITGGVPDVVHEGVNGHLLPHDAGPEAYAELIWRVWSDRERYLKLRRSSWERYDAVLNWRAWLASAAPAVEGALAPSGGMSG